MRIYQIVRRLSRAINWYCLNCATNFRRNTLKVLRRYAKNVLIYNFIIKNIKCLCLIWSPSAVAIRLNLYDERHVYPLFFFHKMFFFHVIPLANYMCMRLASSIINSVILGGNVFMSGSLYMYHALQSCHVVSIISASIRTRASMDHLCVVYN